MRSGAIVMLSGGAIAILGGAFLWRGWARQVKCLEEPTTHYEVCDPFNAPTMTGIVLAPLGAATFVIGGAIALIQTGEKG